MATCYKCGGEIEFYHNGFNAVPIHVGGSCSGSGGSYGYGGGWVERETSTGERFVFGWVEYPSYVNPNATCPRCGKSVFFYQSPAGGRVFFNELGPPWPKHGPSPWECSREDDDNTDQKIPPRFTQPVHDDKPDQTITREILNVITPKWRKAGWSPLLLLKANPSGGGVVLDGSELLEDGKSIERKLVQVDIQDTFEESRGGLSFAYSMTMNPNRLVTALTENVVFIRRVTETIFEFSTISITKNDEIVHFSFRMKSN